ncbi:mitochondrial GTPase 1 [Kwoniella heveanensis CBS 569]|uniref:Mitochondrial GTPase 1 n=1 Tax=Kwoniella heveanensis BCC8398 TaxID=1296120 RepID=A0A1B9GYS5_9TREE|nr:mitochondrial GTPase 1 [Kwoniella heveanensis BCC8398]OCF45170.1 mitochondrial GTPase 1 [Kwoniella heveanensis CBS 569]
MAFIPRATFPYPLKTPSWFAGHMSRSLRELPTLLEDIDLVIEARDSRLPLTSINATFDDMLNRVKSRKGGGSKGKGKEREKLVVYTKRDLAEMRYEEPLKRAFLEHAGQRVMFADTRSDKDVREVLNHAVRIARDNIETIPDLRVLVVGMPNVGKSSLLNALRRVGVRKGKAFRTGAEAGITRKLTGTVRIHEDPSVYVYDTPGVMVPYLGRGEEGAEKGLKLALTAGIKESLFEQDAMADYLLWKMNKRLVAERDLPDGHPDKQTTYLSMLPLPPGFEPTDDLATLLDALCDRLGALKKGGERDYDAGMLWLIRAFREGRLGGWTLDDLVDRQHDGIARKSRMREEDRVDPGEDGVTVGTASVQDCSSSPASPSLVSESQGAMAETGGQKQNVLHMDLDLQVSRAVQKYLARHSSPSSASTVSATRRSNALSSIPISPDDHAQPHTPFSPISANQARKASKRQRLEERDAKLRAKGINVAQRVWAENNTQIGSIGGKKKGSFGGGGGGGGGSGGKRMSGSSFRGQAGRFARENRR